MIEIKFLYIIIFFLTIVQSIAGVGVLMLGTPLLLFFGFGIIEIMITLLPISIITSLSSISLIKYKNKKIYYYNKSLKYFFKICLPSMFIGIFILKKFSDLIDFKIFVSLIILFSILLKMNIKKIILENNLFHKILIFFIGVIHGLSNTGGTLLTIFFVRNDNKNYLNSLYNIHCFYFLLALFQLIILVYFIDAKKLIDLNFSIVI